MPNFVKAVVLFVIAVFLVECIRGWVGGVSIETFAGNQDTNSSKNAADIVENQRKINNFTGLISKKITNLHDQLNKLDKEIEANTAKINANSKASQDKINEYNKQRAQLKKKMAAARHGAVPPPWPGPRPPPSMMPVPIQ